MQTQVAEDLWCELRELQDDENEQQQEEDLHEQHDSHQDASSLAQEEESGRGWDQTLVGFSHCDRKIQGQGRQTQAGCQS